MPPTIEQAIEDNAKNGLASVTVAGQTTVVKSIDEQIKAASFLAAQQAAKKPHFGLRFTRLIPGARS